MSTSPEQNDNEATENLEAESELSMSQSILKGMIGLGLFAIITAGLIALTHTGTADRISEQEKLARSKALFEIVPLDKHDNDLLSDAFWLEAIALGLSEPAEVFIAKTNGKPHTVILPVIAPDGYTGPIRLIAGIDFAGTLQGVRVISHKETPGLGDKIDIRKSDWISAFDGRSLQNTETAKWKVKKDGGEFDQLTGATVTPRAIVHALHKALVFFDQHKEVLYQQVPGSSFDANTAK